MTDQNKMLFHGCIDVEKREKGYLAKRFTPEQFERYTKMPWCIYPYCTAGVFMEFVTAAEEISFDYYFSQLFFSSVVFDIFENDTYMTLVREPDDSKEGRVVYRKKTPGTVRIRIYLPYNGETHISEIRFGDYKTTRDRRRNKLLVYGDSISQGLMGSHPYMSYVPLISDVIGADYLNLSVGGDLFDKNMIDPSLPFTPTAVIVALGTNDLPFVGDYKKIKKNIEDFFARLREVYPNIPVNVISTIWQTDLERFDTEEERNKYKLFMQIYRKTMKESDKAGCNTIDGLKIMPHVPEYFTDHAHPNDMGFLQYALNLLRFLKY